MVSRRGCGEARRALSAPPCAVWLFGSRDAAGKQAARLVDKIIRGADPAELPVETVQTLEFVINFRTSASGARAPGSLPASKVCQVPTPITGSASPVDGIALVMTRSSAKEGRGSCPSAPAARQARSARRRGSMISF